MKPTFCFLMLVASLANASLGAMCKPALAATHWAVLPARPADASAADLMMVSLSQLEGVQLVERAAITKVLNELQLNASGLVDPANAAKLSELNQADAILIVETSQPGQALRVRLIETRTGVRLADEMASPADREQQCAAIAQRLHGAHATLHLKDADRRYVGILGIRSEEPGTALDGTARILTVLLEHDLRQVPGVVVLEREQLTRLTAESNLTGVELNLKASTTLIEGGLRRNAEDAWTVALRLLPLAGGKISDANLVTPPDVGLARQPLLAALTRRLQTSQTRPSAELPDQHQREALLLATRAKWLASHSQHQAAAPLAEAALALDPDRAWFSQTMSIYNRLCSNARLGAKDRLQYSLQANQIDAQYLNRALRTSPGAEGYPILYILGCAIQPEKMDDQEQQVLEEIRQLQRNKFDLLLTARRHHRLSAASLILIRLQKSHYLTDTASKYVDEVQQMLDQLEQETSAGHFRRTLSDIYFRSFFLNLQRNLSEACEQYGCSKISPLLNWLTHHKDPRMRMLGWSGLSNQPGKPGADAARQVLDHWFNELTPGDAKGAEFVDTAIEQAARRLHQTGGFLPWFEGVLEQAESTNADQLIRWESPLRRCLFNVDSSKTVDWCQRVIKLLGSPSAFDPQLATAAAKMKTALSTGIDARLHRGVFAASTAAGWEKYEVEKLSFTGRSSEMLRLTHVTLDQTPGSKLPIVTVWRGSPRISNVGITSGDVLVAGCTQYDGTLHPLGQFRTDEFWTTSMDVSPRGAVALGSRSSGVAIVSRRGVQYFAAKHGLPQSTIQGTAWLNDQLYLAFASAVGRLNVETGIFTLLASSKTVQPKSALDGGSSYQIQSLLADQPKIVSGFRLTRPALMTNAAVSGNCVLTELSNVSSRAAAAI